MAKISLLGIPHDDNSSYLKGPAEAPPLIRREFFSDAYSSWSEGGIDLEGKIVDHGDLRFDGATDPWDHITDRVAETMTPSQPLICLGGDHAVTYPIMRGVRRHHPSLTILHIDAHADIYHAYQNNPRSHASPFARIMEDKLTDQLIQVGLRTIGKEHREQFERFGVQVYEMHRWRKALDHRLTTPVYLSLDIDALDPSCAPGISHREPGGLSTRDVIEIIYSIDQPIVGADIVEYNPRCDISNMTATVAAKLLKEIAGRMFQTMRD